MRGLDHLLIGGELACSAGESCSSATLLGLIVYRLNKDSRSSRARIRLLESDETYENALAKVFVNLERRIEDAVVDEQRNEPTRPRECSRGRAAGADETRMGRLHRASPN